MAILRVNTLLSGAGVVGTGVNQLFFANSDSDAQACTDAVQDFWDALAAQMSNQVTYETDAAVAVVSEITGELIDLVPVTTLPATTGTQTNHMLPTSTQGLIQWRTATVTGGRLLRGRTYVPGMVEDNNFSPGIPGGSWLTVGLAAANALIADATANLCIWHRPVAGSGGGYGDCVAATVWEQWAVLRSRRD